MNKVNKNPVHIPFHNVHRSTVKAISTEESKVSLDIDRISWCRDYESHSFFQFCFFCHFMKKINFY